MEQHLSEVKDKAATGPWAKNQLQFLSRLTRGRDWSSLERWARQLLLWEINTQALVIHGVCPVHRAPRGHGSSFCALTGASSCERLCPLPSNGGLLTLSSQYSSSSRGCSPALCRCSPSLTWTNAIIFHHLPTQICSAWLSLTYQSDIPPWLLKYF